MFMEISSASGTHSEISNESPERVKHTLSYIYVQSLYMHNVSVHLVGYNVNSHYGATATEGRAR